MTAFTEEELRAYDKFWDTVRTEKTLQHDSEKKGCAESSADGKLEQQLESARLMLVGDLSEDDVVRFTGLICSK